MKRSQSASPSPTTRWTTPDQVDDRAALRAVIVDGLPRAKLLNETLRAGDFERALIEWRSLLRHITWAPDYAWNRWRELRAAAERQLDATVSPTRLPKRG